MITACTRLEGAMLDGVIAVAADSGSTVSEVIRDAVGYYLQRLADEQEAT